MSALDPDAPALTVRMLGVFLFVFGVVCCAIAVAHFILGPRAIVGSVPVNATMDGEDRFFAALFFGFGAVMIWTARGPVERAAPLLLLLAIFFLGGVARALSAVQVGMPNMLYVALGTVELILPPIVSIWLQAAVRSKNIQSTAPGTNDASWRAG